MSFAGLLRHKLIIERPYQVFDAGDPALDDYGQPVRQYETLAHVRGLVQPRSAREQAAREVALVSQAGAAISDHTIFLLPTDLTTADRIRYDPDDGRSYEVMSIRDGGGQGHHLEVGARLITSSDPQAS